MNRPFRPQFSDCDDKLVILKNETVPRRLSSFETVTKEDVEDKLDSMYVYADAGNISKKMSLANLIEIASGEAKPQADWNETDPEKTSFIKNKPELGLERDVLAKRTVGGIKAGTIIPQHTSITSILEMLLSTGANYMLYFGLFDSKPSFLESFVGYELDSLSPLELVIKPHSQIVAVAIPDMFHYRVKAITEHGFEMSFASYKPQDDFTVYYLVDEDGEPTIASGDHRIKIELEEI